jgi:hypothetical protein
MSEAPRLNTELPLRTDDAVSNRTVSVILLINVCGELNFMRLFYSTRPTVCSHLSDVANTPRWS